MFLLENMVISHHSTSNDVMAQTTAARRIVNSRIPNFELTIVYDEWKSVQK